MAKKKKEEAAVEATENKVEETQQKEMIPVEQGLIDDLVNKTQISGIMLSLMRTVIPNITAGALNVRESYYDKDKKATVIALDVHGESDYEVKAEITIDGAWVVDLYIKNLSTGMVRRFNYSESKGYGDEDE